MQQDLTKILQDNDLAAHEHVVARLFRYYRNRNDRARSYCIVGILIRYRIIPWTYNTIYQGTNIVSELSLSYRQIIYHYDSTKKCWKWAIFSLIYCVFFIYSPDYAPGHPPPMGRRG